MYLNGQKLHTTRKYFRFRLKTKFSFKLQNLSFFSKFFFWLFILRLWPELNWEFFSLVSIEKKSNTNFYRQNFSEERNNLFKKTPFTGQICSIYRQKTIMFLWTTDGKIMLVKLITQRSSISSLHLKMVRILDHTYPNFKRGETTIALTWQSLWLPIFLLALTSSKYIKNEFLMALTTKKWSSQRE